MPKATVSIEPERKDLESCPGGFVVLKRLSYGQFLARQDMSMEMKFGNKNSDSQGDITLMQRRVVAYEFANCIIEHNLEDSNGKLLNFKDPNALSSLDPRIGNEINKYIDEMHQFTDPEEMANLTLGSEQPLF